MIGILLAFAYYLRLDFTNFIQTTNTMNQDIPSNSSNFNQKINPEQFDQIVEAILAGKYSWACVLVLRLGGYNPLHYIPYRTYNRLLKENSQGNKSHQRHHESVNDIQASTAQKSENNIAASCLGKIKDLALR